VIVEKMEAVFVEIVILRWYQKKKKAVVVIIAIPGLY
jgi:hypothetical protein